MQSGQRIKIFTDIIVKYFTAETLDRAITFAFGESVYTRVGVGGGGGGLVHLAFKLVESMKVARWKQLADALIAQIIADKGDPDALRRELAVVLAPLPGVDLGAHAVHQALLLSAAPPAAFINREALRAHLEELSLPGAVYPALSILGGRGTGKTYSWDLIAAVARDLGAIPVYVDTDALELAPVCELIALRLGLDKKEMRAQVLADEPKAERVAVKFVAWLGSTLSALGSSKVWLALDSLNTASAEVCELLLPNLLKAIRRGDSPSLFLVLVGYDARKIPTLRNWVLHEDITELTTNEIEAFVREYARRRDRKLRDDEVRLLVDRIVGPAKWPYDREAMESISLQAGLVAKVVLQ